MQFVLMWSHHSHATTEDTDPTEMAQYSCSALDGPKTRRRSLSTMNFTLCTSPDSNVSRIVVRLVASLQMIVPAFSIAACQPPLVVVFVWLFVFF